MIADQNARDQSFDGLPATLAGLASDVLDQQAPDSQRCMTDDLKGLTHLKAQLFPQSDEPHREPLT